MGDQQGVIFAIEDRIYACLMEQPLRDGEVRIVVPDLAGGRVLVISADGAAVALPDALLARARHVHIASPFLQPLLRAGLADGRLVLLPDQDRARYLPLAGAPAGEGSYHEGHEAGEE